MAATLTVELKHRSSIPGARWCNPVGWEPANEIDGAELIDGLSWWPTDTADGDEVAGLVAFAQGDEGDVIDVDLADLRVASCGDCRVIGAVELVAS